MNAFADFLSIEHDTGAKPVPLFRVDAPDGKRHLAEIDRQATFRRIMRECAPRVTLYANANAGRRRPGQARKEGIRSGVFDMTGAWPLRCIAFPEFKGYDSSGRAGTLSEDQIRWGNEMLEIGHHVASFFDPMAAVLWFKEIGAPVRIGAWA